MVCGAYGPPATTPSGARALWDERRPPSLATLREIYKSAWFTTYTGRKFDFLDPRPEDVCIEDVAYSLGNYCRFGGHCLFYPVAQHSVWVSRRVPNFKFRGLMHDSAEAFCGDMIRPLKDIVGPLYRLIEREVDKAICLAVGLNPVMTDDERDEIKRWDNVALVTERRDVKHPPLFNDAWKVDQQGYLPEAMVITRLAPEAAAEQFLQRYRELKEAA